MDARKCMIVDLERRGDSRMFVTESVEYINKSYNGLWRVRFSSTSKLFNYNPSRLLYLTNPVSIDTSNKGVYINNIHIHDIKELLRFSNEQYTFYYAIHDNGFCENLESQYIYISRTPINQSGKSTWDYLRKLAEETGLLNEEKENILTEQYDSVDIFRDNVPLAQYLGKSEKLATYCSQKCIVYPFGCNASQKEAVEKALAHQLSIIQGPPGTGKTQTILNIVSNLLMAGKTVLIVSNNNSAIENVAEKLQREGLGFIVAKLGSLENKENFIDNQPEYPNLNECHIDDTSNIEASAISSLNSLSKAFEGQFRIAVIKTELNALNKEFKYNEMLKDRIDTDSWLISIKSDKLVKFLTEYKIKTEYKVKLGLWFCLKWSLSLGLKTLSLVNNDPSKVIDKLEAAYYSSRKTELERELESIEESVRPIEIKRNIDNLKSCSMQLLKNNISQRFKQNNRRKFKKSDIKYNTKEFLLEYPVVLSTTYSARKCINPDMVYDYVIMDEASQVDIKTGTLALSCANNAVIVGDSMQLPNVVGKEEKQALKAIQDIYQVEDKYDATNHSFLDSCVEVFSDAPVTMLREHYRCHPKIIEFCNQRFYNGQLITMTEDRNEKDVLEVIRTVPGNHAREHINQREIDSIIQEVMPKYNKDNTLGIITPYRLQANAINYALSSDIANTVHKYQGRECDAIILSTVDNELTEFLDDDNLLNVAISRAKSHLCIVTNGNEMPKDSNIAQLIAYIRYNNFDIKYSRLHSVFDLLYKQYTTERLAYEATHKAISKYLSENLIYDLLSESIDKLALHNLKVLCHYPMSKLISDTNILDKREKSFVNSPFSHIDFLVYNTITKQPAFAIEVDGWHFHKGNEVQVSRDDLKDCILAKYGLQLIRISTTDMVNMETIVNLISTNYSR